MTPQLIAAAVVALAGFGSAWQIQTWRYGAREAAHEQQKLADQQRAAAAAIRQSEAVIAAQSAAAARVATMRRDADGARAALVSLHDAADAAMRSAETSHAACLVAADAERVVLGQCSESYRSLAEVADGHAGDVKTLMDAWPR
jgi:hypothetical protein